MVKLTPIIFLYYKQIMNVLKGLLSDTSYLLQFDGLAAPNPGEATSGAVLFKGGVVVFEVAEYLGFGTNNQAEYNSLLLGLRRARDIGVKELRIEGDSNLVVKQVSGLWKVKDLKLKVICDQIKEIVEKDFDFVSISHVYRDYNKHADALTNECLALKKGFYRSYL